MKNDDAIILASLVAGAVLLTTFKTSEKAKVTRVPTYVAARAHLYTSTKDGRKKFICKTEKPAIKLQQHFKLKHYANQTNEDICRHQWFGQ